MSGTYPPTFNDWRPSYAWVVAIGVLIGWLVPTVAGCTPRFAAAALHDVANLAERVCVEGEDWRACLERCEAAVASGGPGPPPSSVPPPPPLVETTPRPQASEAPPR